MKSSALRYGRARHSVRAGMSVASTTACRGLPALTFAFNERSPTKIRGITFEAFPVEHSILAPAVGYRVSAGRASIFYVPDLVFIHERAEALKNVQIYIGDGATVMRSFIRRRDKALIGNSPVRTKLTWCEKEGVPQAIVTHCGSEIVTGDEGDLSAKLRVMASERGVDMRIAYDGMKLKL